MAVNSTTQVSSTIRNRRSAEAEVREIAHEDYLNWLPEWHKLRDAVQGEKAIHEGTIEYLPPYSKMDDSEYNKYLQRAPYFNMTGRTVKGMVGTIFAKEPKIEGFNKSQTELLDNVGFDRSSIFRVMKKATMEVMTVGRLGILVDVPTSGGTPYLSIYKAEDILNWISSEVDGRKILVSVTLRETTGGSVRIRHLFLGTEGYVQRIFEDKSADVFKDKPDFEIRPSRRSTPLNFIPFQFFGAETNLPDIEVPPVLDIANLNIHHYNSSAQLEHGRWYVGLPVYTVSGMLNSSEAEYKIAPDTVWQLTENSKASILEFNGTGLMTLERATKEKEDHISALGGRMINNRESSTGKSVQETRMTSRNEKTLLLDIVTSLEEGFLEVLNWWSSWLDSSAKPEITLTFNRNFTDESLTARDLIAVSRMYASGQLTLRVFYELFRDNNIIPEDMTIEEYKESLKNPDEFPNNPDVHAKQLGFPDAQTKISSEADDE